MRFLIILLSLYSSLAFASNLEVLRQLNCTEVQKVECNRNKKLENHPMFAPQYLLDATTPVLEKELLLEQAELFQKEIQSKVDQWADFKRFIGIKKKFKWSRLKRADIIATYKDKFLEIEKDFNELKRVQKELDKLQNQLDFCYNSGCGASWKLDLEDSKKAHELYKEKIIGDNIWFGSDELENYLRSENKDSLLNLLFKEQAKYFKLASSHNTRSAQLMRRLSKSLEVSPTISMSLTTLQATHSDNLVEGLIERMFKNWGSKEHEERKVICGLAKKQIKARNTVEYTKRAIDIGLFGISFIPTPMTASLKFMPSLNAAKFFNITSRSYFTANMLKDYNAKKLECENRFVQYITDSGSSENLNDYNNCLNEVEDMQYNYILGLLPYEQIIKFPNLLTKMLHLERTLKLNPRYIPTQEQLKEYIAEGSRKIATGERYFVTGKGPNGNSTSFFDVSQMYDISSNNINNYVDEYINFVGKVYKERLSLSDKMVDKFVESAKFMKYRMKVITITENAPKTKNNIFKGGMSIIESKKKGEVLPFEISTGIRVPRTPGETIVELSRVAVDKGQGSGEVLKELVEQSVNLIKADPSITKVYYFTSKAHHKVYARYGFNGKVIHSPNDKEVVVEIDIKELLAQAS